MHDLDADGLVGRTAFASAGDARAAQERIQKNPVIKGLFASAQQDLRWRMSVEHDASRLCVLSERLKSDLWEISKKCEGGPIGYLAHLRSIGLRTVALRMDDPSLQYLHEPWASSGFMLAPMLTGFCMSRFGGKK